MKKIAVTVIALTFVFTAVHLSFAGYEFQYCQKRNEYSIIADIVKSSPAGAERAYVAFNP
jgi:hypothetical protein